MFEEYDDKTFKDIDLREAKRLLKRFENQLEYWETERETAFEETQPRATSIEEKTQGGTPTNKNDVYLIKIEKIDKKINIIKKRIRNLMSYIENELKIIGEYDPIEEEIIRLREEKRKKWYEISSITGYCERQCQRIYDKYLDRKRKSRVDV